MMGFVMLVGFLAAGVGCVWALLPGAARAIRVYAGLCAGLAMMMWLPSLVAFFTGFTAAAQWIALGIAAVPAMALHGERMRNAGDRQGHGQMEAEWQHPPFRLTLALVMPLALLSAYLLHTHILRPEMDGAMHVGQSTYGDLPLHLGIATGLRGAAYPPEYTLLPGTLLGYPFLSDALVASMLMLGSGLRASYCATSLLMMVLVYWGFALLAWRLTRNAGATALGFVLFFLNGGLGFLYIEDLGAVFTEFYRTPTNMPDLNLRWVNVICDLMIPQRTLLAGWMMLLPALMLLHEAVRRPRIRLFVLLGAWAGMMPMVHTHSFLALGLCSVGTMAHTLIVRKDDRAVALKGFLLYGGIAVALAAPQMFVWTLPQTLAGGSLKFWFNWVNQDGAGGLIDNYLWFWLKNLGPVALVMLPAGFAAKGSRRTMALGALCIFVAAECVLFQPNAYDNNKLFTVAFMLMTPLCAHDIVTMLGRISGRVVRCLCAALFVAVSVLSAGLSIGREVVSDYQLFDAGEVAAAQYVEAHAPMDAVFAMNTQHDNVISSLTGRKLVCGTPTFLFFHGVDYQRQMEDLRLMFEQPQQHRALFEGYGVDYVYVSNWERGNYDVDEYALGEMFPLWYERGDTSIYEVRWDT